MLAKTHIILTPNTHPPLGFASALHSDIPCFLCNHHSKQAVISPARERGAESEASALIGNNNMSTSLLMAGPLLLIWIPFCMRLYSREIET